MDVVTFGETMVLFTPTTTGLMRNATNFSRKYGGAESNFAIGLTRLGHKVGWFSRVGKDELGKGLIAFLRGEGIDISKVKIDEGAPTGIYFKELRNSNNLKVYYYRKGSAASRMSVEDIDGEYLASAKYLFISGITPALSDSCREMVIKSIEIAKAKGLKVIFDPNLRKTLWSEEDARKTLLDLTSKVDIILPGILEGQFLFGEKDPAKLGELFLQKGPSLVVMKLGEKGAAYFTKEQSEFVSGFPIGSVVDPVGAGDGFAAGFVSGLLENLTLEDAVRRGNAVGAIVTTVEGDIEGLPEREDLMKFMAESTEDVHR